jgi:hypothetical protein
MMVGMQPGQFTLKRAMVSTVVIAIGCFGLSMLVQGRVASIEYEPMRLVASFFACTACIWITAGVGTLFNRWPGRPWFGIVMQIILLRICRRVRQMPRPRFSLNTLLIVVTAIALAVGIARVLPGGVYVGLMIYLLHCAAIAVALLLCGYFERKA